MEDTKDVIYEIETAAEAMQQCEADAQENFASADIPVSLGSPDPSDSFDLSDSSDPSDMSDASDASDASDMSELDALLKDIGMEEVLSLIRKGRAYDEDVAEAETRGEIAGRNAKIEQLLDSVAADRHPERNLSSGLPIGKTIRSIFDLADLA